MDRLQSMRVFQQVVDDGSFAAAARRLDLSAAVVTRLVGDLEEHLGVRLLQRTTRHLALTDAGETYLARVRHILSDIDEAHTAAQAHAQEMSGVLRIYSPPIFGVHVLAWLVAEFGRRYPKVVLDIYLESQRVPPVEDYDLTLLGAADTFDANIIARPIASSHGILCASPAYLRENGIPQQPEDLARHRWLRIRSAANRHRMLRLINPADSRLKLDIQIEPALLTNQSDTLIQACIDGAGIISQPVALVAKLLESGELRRVLPPWTTGKSTLYAALPSRKFIPAKTRAFLEFLTEHTRAVVGNRDAPQD
jgi:DNA-binding transcriptional LysR family regulator